MKKYILFLFMVLTSISCGTDTGNPSAQHTGGRYSPGYSFANLFRDSICIRLYQCLDEVTTNDCKFYFPSLDNLNTKLGFQENDFTNFSDILVAEFEGKISVDWDKAEACYNDVKDLSCNDPAVQSAYDDQLRNPYSGVKDLVPDSCSMVYSMTEN